MKNTPPGSPAAGQQDSLFGHFAKAQSLGTGISVPFDKDMAYAVTWVPTRKLLMIYGFDPLTPKPFMTAKLHTAGLQHKSYYQIRQDIFQGYSFDVILLPLDPGTPSPAEDQVLKDYLEMQDLAPSYRHGPAKMSRIFRGHAKLLGGEKGKVTLTTKSGEDLKFGEGGGVALPEA